MEDAVRSVDILHNQPFVGRNLLVSGANERQEQSRQPRETREPQEEQVSMEEMCIRDSSWAETPHVIRARAPKMVASVLIISMD